MKKVNKQHEILLQPTLQKVGAEAVDHPFGLAKEPKKPKNQTNFGFVHLESI